MKTSTKSFLILIITFLLLNNSSKAQCWDTIATGMFYNLAIKSDGTLWAWGRNNYAQLGDGTSTNRNTPTQIGTATNWKQIACGWQHSLAIKTDGTLWAWGYNFDGQLGDGTTIDIYSPTQIGTANNWKQISGGFYHTLALKTNGTLWAWGRNGNGQLGDGTIANKTSPTQIGTATNWKQINCGGNHSSALKTDGTLWTWGWNSFGQLGDGTTTDKNTPTQIGLLTNWKYIACADYHTVSLKTDGTLWNWGQNTSGQLGDGTTVNKTIPTQIGTATNWNKIDGGSFHSLAVKTDGSLWGWGDNSSGQLGNGTTTNTISPTQIGTAANWKQANCGANHSSSLKTDYSNYACGQNTFGQLGDGTFTDKLNSTLIGSACVIAPCTANITIFSPFSSGVICSGTLVPFSTSITNGGNSPVYQWKKNGANVGTGLTTYTNSTLVDGDVINCILTSNALCASTSTVSSNSITFTVYITPTITVNSGSICSGNSFTMIPNGASTYTYSSGSSIVSPTVNSTYTVIGRSNDGCISEVAAISNVTVNALPTIGITTSNSLLCVGQSADLTASGGDSYLWNTSSTNTVIAISPTITTNYTVTGIDANGCENMATITQSVSTCTNLENLGVINLHSLYPNPNNGTFTIDLLNAADISIFNILGEMVYTNKLTGGKQDIDITGSSNGLYFIKVSTSGSQQTYKIIKN